MLTFHELCLRLGREAKTLPDPEPAEKTQEWWDKVLPGALDAAIPEVGGRYHAIVVDEGQDFEKAWLESLYLMLVDPDKDVLYVFHDPDQALYRDDVVGDARAARVPPRLELPQHGPDPPLCRPLRAGAGAARGAARGGPGRSTLVPSGGTLEALRKVLHRLVVEERLAPWQIAVLTGVSLARSAVWKHRQFGNQVLWNGSYDELGQSLGLPADQAPDQPTDTILCDSIRRFKGLEREVDRPRRARPVRSPLRQLMYVGATRARQHLIVIA